MAVMETVQALASTLSKKVDGAIPSGFIRPEYERPGTTTFRGPVPEIPVVDLLLLQADHDRIVKAVAEAAEEWGMFQIVNHGIPAETIEALQRVGRGFFELPQEEKEKYAAVPDSGSIEGYGSKLGAQPEGKRAWVDYLFHNVWPESRVNYKFFPQTPPDYRKVNKEYARYLVPVIDEMLTSLSLGLGLEGHVMKEAVGGEWLELLLKVNYYPPCPCPELALGLGAHTDLCAITLLIPNEVPGLQVFKDDHWFDAKYIPNAIIVHIGDQIEILSNGKYKGVLHRTTVNKEKLRMSWPVFCSPPGDKVIGPLPQLVSDANPAKFKTKKFKDYKYCKLNQLPQ